MSQQIQSLETSKVLAEMGRSWQAEMSKDQNFLVKLGQTHDKQMLKVSLRYLDSCLSYWQMTEILL